MADATVVMCTMVKDQSHSVRAWVEFHRLQGVTNFSIYDDGSADYARLVSELHGLPARVLPVVHCSRHGGLSQHDGCQKHVYAQCLADLLRAHGPEAWVGLVDVDEYWFAPARNASLASVLHAAADRGVVAMGAVSRYFGTSGHHGRCSDMTDMARTHFGRYPISKQEVNPEIGLPLRPYSKSLVNSKQPWLLLAAAVPNATRRGYGRIGIHEHPVAKHVYQTSKGRNLAIGDDCHRLLGTAKIGSRFISGEHDGVWQQCRHRQTVPAWSPTLRYHHYRFLSDECVQEKARANHVPFEVPVPGMYSAVRDEGILPFLPTTDTTAPLPLLPNAAVARRG